MIKEYLHSLYGIDAPDTSLVKGYSDEEISAIERLYKRKIQGQFRDFLMYIGRSDGYTWEQAIIPHRTSWSVRDHYIFQFRIDDEMQDASLEYFFYHYFDPIIFCFCENKYYFILTEISSGNKQEYNLDTVHYFDINTKELNSTNLLFNDFMKYFFDKINPEKKNTASENGEIILIDLNKNRIIEPDYDCLESYIMYLFGDYISKEHIEDILRYAQGYSNEEINKIECFYDIHAFKELKNFLFFIGRCSGGVLSSALISVLYKPYLNNVGYQNSLRSEMIEHGFNEYINEKPFFIADDDGTYLPYENIVIKHNACIGCERRIFVLTAEKNPTIYYMEDYYDESRKPEIKKTEYQFDDYIRSLLSYEYPENDRLYIGEMIDPFKSPPISPIPIPNHNP